MFTEQIGSTTGKIVFQILLMKKNGKYLTFQVVLVVKNLPARTGDIKDTGSIAGQEDPLEKEMATHSSILA